jgi:hypothetical protein
VNRKKKSQQVVPQAGGVDILNWEKQKEVTSSVDETKISTSSNLEKEDNKKNVGDLEEGAGELVVVAATSTAWTAPSEEQLDSGGGDSADN